MRDALLLTSLLIACLHTGIARADDPPPAPDRIQDQIRIPPDAEKKSKYLQLRSGDERTEGTILRLDCRPNGQVIALLRVGDKKVDRYTARRLTDIDFISYRSDVTGAVSCGPRRPPDRVYLTWKKPPDARALDGIVVAIEFLPAEPRDKR